MPEQSTPAAETHGQTLELEVGTPEWIYQTLLGGGEINYERHPGDLLALANHPEQLAQARFQICLGGDPIPSLRTPAAVVNQLKAMAELQAAGREPPSFLVLQSSLWQQYENGIDARGEIIDPAEMAAGSLEELALIKLFAQRFFPQVADKLSFAWLPYNRESIDFIDSLTPSLEPLLPEKIRTLSEKSANGTNPYRYTARHVLSYGAGSSQPAIATGGKTEVPFQQVAAIGAQAFAPEGPPLALITYPEFGASYYYRQGEPTFASLNGTVGNEPFPLKPPLVETTHRSNGNGRQPKAINMGRIVEKEYRFLQQATNGEYANFLHQLKASGFPQTETSPETRFIHSIRILTGWPEATYEELIARLLEHSERTCHENLNWPLD